MCPPEQLVRKDTTDHEFFSPLTGKKASFNLLLVNCFPKWQVSPVTNGLPAFASFSSEFLTIRNTGPRKTANSILSV